MKWFKKFIEIMEKADDTITEFDEEMWIGGFSNNKE